MCRFVVNWVVLPVLAWVCGCATFQPSAAQLSSNPILVPASNFESVWERTVDVIHAFHFSVARESRLEGSIETDWKTGAGMLEPWHHDSVGADERLESSLQSIRRRAVVHVVPAEGGHLIGMEVFKELEDAPAALPNSAGAASFQESTPLDRDLERVVESDGGSTWIPLGRDIRLEQTILASLRRSFGI